MKTRSAKIALGVLAVVGVLVVFGGLIAPDDPLHQNVAVLLQGPSVHHLLGTDYLGRDVLSRLLAGARLSILSGLEAVVIGLAVGVLPGIASALLGGWVDYALNRITDALMTLPSIVLAITITAVLGNGLVQAMFAIGVLLAPVFFRVVRAATLQFANAHYVEAAELLGASKVRVIRVHVWRKVVPTITVTAASASASALLTVSSLTFLGIGVQPPAPTWGGILSSDLSYLSQAPWAPIAPALFIAITVGALNTLADAIRDRTAGTATALVTEISTADDTNREYRDDGRRSAA
jgi:peptide/nickel transport system permease protein